MTSNGLIILLTLFIIVLSFILLINKRKNNRNVIFLALFLVFYSIINLNISIMAFGGPVYLFAIVLNNFTPVYFLLPVMLYFFVRGIATDSFLFKKTDILHLIPFIISFVAIIPYVLTPFEYKYSIAEKLAGNFSDYSKFNFGLFYPQFLNNLVAGFQFVGYLTACIVILLQFRSKLKQCEGLLKNQFYFVYGSLILILSLYVIFSVLNFIISFELIQSGNFNGVFSLTLKMLMHLSYFYLIIPLYILVNPRLIYGVPQRYDFSDQSQQIFNGVNKVSLIMLSNKIVEYLKTDKPYLNPDFSVRDISSKLNVPTHHVEYCLNIILNKKFGELKKGMKVNHAIELIKQNHLNGYSFEDIARKSGFTTYTDFYYSFKNLTGYSPQNWLQIYNKQTILN